MIISTKTDVGERTNNGEDSNQDVKDFSDPDLDEVLNNVSYKSSKKVENVHASSFGNRGCGIILRNDLG